MNNPLVNYDREVFCYSKIEEICEKETNKIFLVKLERQDSIITEFDKKSDIAWLVL